ncbi:hypothetical protein [Eudoraea sp.]|jgi:hypothetical protein
MISVTIPLVNWSNGIVMIAVFGAVVIALVAILINLMNSDKK